MISIARSIPWLVLLLLAGPARAAAQPAPEAASTPATAATTPTSAGVPFPGTEKGSAAFCEGRPDPVRLGPDESGPEIRRIRIVNRIFGAVSVSLDQGASWTVVGRVLHPDLGIVHAIGPMEFTAADWAPMPAVAATAVNAIHCKVGQTDPHAVVFSILPKEMVDPNPNASFRDADASLITDVPAGTRIFDLESAPRVGDGLFLEDMLSRRLSPWPVDHAPGLGDRIVIVSRRSPYGGGVLEIENAKGGLATWTGPDGHPHQIGITLRRVSGCGRFGGTAYQDVGRVRANHPGVLCLCTSPMGQLGGMQIVPCHHASDPVLAYVPSTPAYLVLGEAPGGNALEGTAPIFGRAFRPGDRWQVRIAGIWQTPPPSVGRVDDALDAVEALRVYAAP